jgi:hypothetical protein
MGFVMPKEVAVKGIPKPTGENVEIRKRCGGRFAVLRLSVHMNEKTSQNADEKLRSWMKREESS